MPFLVNVDKELCVRAHAAGLVRIRVENPLTSWNGADARIEAAGRRPSWSLCRRVGVVGVWA